MAIGLILFLGLVLRLINLNQSLWLDEAVQAVTSQGPLNGIFSELRGDFHPPLYHLLMWAWVHFFGSSEVVLRLPSVLFGVGTIWVVGKMGEIGVAASPGKNPSGLGFLTRRVEELAKPSLARLAPLLMAIAPYHIYYSQEARMYAMTAFFASFSMYWFLKFFTPEESLRATSQVAGYILATVLMLYSDYYGFLVLLAQLIAGLIILKKKIVSLSHCFLVPLLLFLPWLPFFFIQLKTGFQATHDLPDWANLVNMEFVKALPLTFLKFAIGRITIFNKRLYALVALGILGIFGGIGARGARRKIRRFGGQGGKRGEKREFFWVILIWLIVPILVAWLASLFVPNYQPFRLLLVLPAFYLLLAIGISSINSKVVRFLALFFILLTSYFSLLTYYTNSYFHREDWRGVANYLKREQVPIVISSKTFDWPLAYYGVTSSAYYGATSSAYYGVSSQTISVSTDIRPVEDEDKIGLIRQIGLIEGKELAYTPYLADVYDPLEKVPDWLNKAGFVRIKEISFNQIPVWIYQKQ